jgi:hypothetical protein
MGSVGNNPFLTLLSADFATIFHSPVNNVRFIAEATFLASLSYPLIKGGRPNAVGYKTAKTLPP